jgi:thymidine kinase
MAKLYFRYGAMGSAKTLNLLAVAHNYNRQGKKAFLIKPKLDVRFGVENIRSRAGLEMKADLLVTPKTSLKDLDLEKISCILVDEAQFMSSNIIETLREITLKLDIPVICYGLRADFKSYLFEGSKRLMELADSIEEMKSTCNFCDKKAIMNLKHVDGVATVSGPSIQLGAEEMYYPACYKCYRDQVDLANNQVKEKENIEV